MAANWLVMTYELITKPSLPNNSTNREPILTTDSNTGNIVKCSDERRDGNNSFICSLKKYTTLSSQQSGTVLKTLKMMFVVLFVLAVVAHTTSERHVMSSDIRSFHTVKHALKLRKYIYNKKPNIILAWSSRSDAKLEGSRFKNEEEQVIIIPPSFLSPIVYKSFRVIDSAMMTNPGFDPRSNTDDDGDGGFTRSFGKGENCVRQYDWQVATFPSCNNVHEINVADPNSTQLVNYGYFRDVWKTVDTSFSGESVALKTMRYKKSSFRERDYEKSRIDAVTMERLTSSPYIPNIYGFCGSSGYFEYSSDGNIYDEFWSKGLKNKSSQELTFLKALQVAEEVALGLTALHTIEGEGHSTIVHSDVAPKQYLFIDGKYKLNDFNRSKFLGWNKKLHEVCPIFRSYNGGRYRSPEEYAHGGETEKIDIYSMGNIIYSLTTGYAKPFCLEGISSEEAQNFVMSGGRPQIPQEIITEREKSPAVDALLKAIEMCWDQDPKKRAKAKDVAVYIRKRLDELETTNT